MRSPTVDIKPPRNNNGEIVAQTNEFVGNDLTMSVKYDITNMFAIQEGAWRAFLGECPPASYAKFSLSEVLWKVIPNSLPSIPCGRGNPSPTNPNYGD
jgi:hypothetical protein